MILTHQAELLYHLFENQDFEPGDIVRMENILGKIPYSLWAIGAKRTLPELVGRGLIKKIGMLSLRDAELELTQRGWDALVEYMDDADNSTHNFSEGIR